MFSARAQSGRKTSVTRVEYLTSVRIASSNAQLEMKRFHYAMNNSKSMDRLPQSLQQQGISHLGLADGFLVGFAVEDVKAT